MRKIFAAVVIATALSSHSGASSFTAPDAVASEQQPASPSIIYLGAAEPEHRVDHNETASVGSEVAAKPGAVSAAAQKQADAEWAQVSAIRSPSIIYYGRPLPAAKAAEPEVAAFDPNQMPMVMRGGIEGDALPAPTAAPEPEAKSTDETAAATDVPEPAVAP